MNLSAFKAGASVQRVQYKSFEPAHINTHWHMDDDDLNMLLSIANLKLGELNAFSQLIPDIDFFIKMYVVKEGTQSTKIEGTQTNIDEAIQSEWNISPEKLDDWQEVQHYVQAMNEAVAGLEKLPISNRLLKQMNRTLLQGVRGKHKLPGEFRSSQNWIGGSSLVDAAFIPPHPDSIADYMADLEQFIHNPNLSIPHLIKIGMIHFQFETIHPFLDGNGRLGRLLITLFLVSHQLLVKPTLYLSDFFEKHRTHYFDKLTTVRTQNDMVQWLKFFLEGVRSTAESAIQTLKDIIVLRSDCENLLVSLGKKQLLAKQFLNYLYSHPITDATSAAKDLGISITTTLRLIDDLVRMGMLIESTGNKRNRVFVFERYMQLFRR